MKGHLRVQTANPHRLSASFSTCIAALISFALLPSTALAQNGDMNCDGAVDVADIPLFVQALLEDSDFGGCDINRADMNADTLIDGLDTQPFVAALLAPCPPGFALCGAVCVDTLWNGNNCGGCGNICPPLEHCSFGVCEGNCIGCEP